jgi:hypothetical protein
MKSHRTDTVSLVFGLLFLIIVGWWLLGRMVNIGLPTLGWAVAVGLLALGVLGLVGVLRGASRGGPNRPDDGSEDS